MPMEEMGDKKLTNTERSRFIEIGSLLDRMIEDGQAHAEVERNEKGDPQSLKIFNLAGTVIYFVDIKNLTEAGLNCEFNFKST